MSGEMRKTGKPQLSFLEYGVAAGRYPDPMSDFSWIFDRGISLSIIGDLQEERKIFNSAGLVRAIIFPDMKKKGSNLVFVMLFLFFIHPPEVGLQSEDAREALLADQWMPLQRELNRGVFLVSAEQLVDPNFSQTVVVLLEYGEEGAMGLIINRPTKVRLSEVFPDIRRLRRRRDRLFVGGPVHVEQILLLVRSKEEPEDSFPVFEDVYVCSSLEELERIVKNRSPDEDFRIFAGYAGWAPGQLDAEVMRGDWRIVRADAESIFSPAPEKLWQELARKTRAQWTKREPSYPVSCSLNV
jgi:putative transcriptional regulator